LPETSPVSGIGEWLVLSLALINLLLAKIFTITASDNLSVVYYFINANLFWYFLS